MKNILTLILAIVFIATLSIISVNAEPAFIFEQDQESNITISCFDTDNAYCSSTTLCNLTVFNPDNSLLINNQLMSHQGSHYNYTLLTTETNNLGEYSVIAMCDGSEDGYSTFSYEVTKTGRANEPEYALPVVLGMVALMIFFGIVAFILHSRGQSFFSYLSGIIAMLILLANMAAINTLISGEGATGIVTSSYIALTYIFRIVLWGGVLWLFYYAYKQLMSLAEQFNRLKMGKRGDEGEEEEEEKK